MTRRPVPSGPDHRRSDPAADDGVPPSGAARSRVPPVAAVASAAGSPYRRDPDGRWRRAADDAEVPGATDLRLADLFDPPVADGPDGPVRLVPRAWASRHPDHPLAWTFEHAELGDRGPIAVPVAAWDERAAEVVAPAAPELHPWNLVGVDGVAGLLGVAEPTVRSYLARRQMPEPLVRLGGSPVWARAQIEAWAAGRRRARRGGGAGGRAPDPEAEAEAGGGAASGGGAGPG